MNERKSELARRPTRRRGAMAGTLEHLDRDEAFRMLAHQAIGRVRSAPAARPLLPVNSWSWRRVACDPASARSWPGPLPTEGRVRGRRVGRPVAHGWSVLLTGVAEEVTRPSELAEVERLAPAAMGAGPEGPRRAHPARRRHRPTHPPAGGVDGELPARLLTGPDPPSVRSPSAAWHSSTRRPRSTRRSGCSIRGSLGELGGAGAAREPAGPRSGHGLGTSADAPAGLAADRRPHGPDATPVGGRGPEGDDGAEPRSASFGPQGVEPPAY